MIKKWVVFGFLLCVIGFVIIMAGCGQQSLTSVTGDYTKASTDLKNAASGLQSAGGNISKSIGSGEGVVEGAGALSLSDKSPGVSAQNLPAGWDPTKTVSWESTYTWTTSTGTVVTEEVETYFRYLDADGNQLGLNYTDLITWEGESLDGATFLAKKQQTVSIVSSSYYNGYISQLTEFPPIPSLPYIMNTTAEGWITFSGTTVSTFEILSLDLTVTIAGATTATGSMNWGYRAPGSTYAYYYGAVNINISNLDANPFAMTGDVYQDLTDDGVTNGNKVGIITFEESGSIKITLDNGTVIYAGMF